MSAWDNQDRPRDHRPAPFDFDAQWDAEEALRQREQSYRPAYERQSASTPPQERPVTQERRTQPRGQQTRRPAGKRRKKRSEHSRMADPDRACVSRTFGGRWTDLFCRRSDPARKCATRDDHGADGIDRAARRDHCRFAYARRPPCSEL